MPSRRYRAIRAITHTSHNPAEDNRHYYDTIMNWQNYEDIGIALYEKFPELDPLTIRFTDLLQWITELEDFTGDPKESNEKKLEAVQMAWYEEWKDNQ